jgi:hypothetical protein
MCTATVLKLVFGLMVIGAAVPAAGASGPPDAGPADDASGHRGELAAALADAAALQREDGESRGRYAELLYEAGEFESARDVVAPLLARPDPELDDVMLGGRLAYLLGRYAETESLFRQALSIDPENSKALAGLVFTYYQTNRYDRCLDLPKELRDNARLPHLDMMLAFEGEEPYRLEWDADGRVEVPFLSTDPLPVVSVEVEGREVSALIDTGGDAFILDSEIADSLGIEIVASMMGMFAGGQEAEVGFAKARSLSIGGVTLHSVPVSVLPTKRLTLGEHVIGGILGTGVLRQFLSTLDYPNGRLILRPSSAEAAAAFRDDVRGRIEDEIPFYLQGTHFLLAHGSLNGHGDLLFHVDSGLAGEPAFAAPRQTLEYVGIPIPEIAVREGTIGGGGGGFATGQFPIETLGLGRLTQRDLVGSFGAQPPGSYRMLGFIVDGLISHNFLRQYAWTIDFSGMRMVFSS